MGGRGIDFRCYYNKGQRLELSLFFLKKKVSLVLSFSRGTYILDSKSKILMCQLCSGVMYCCKDGFHLEYARFIMSLF